MSDDDTPGPTPMHYELRPNRAEVRDGQHIPEHDVPLPTYRDDSIGAIISRARYIRRTARDVGQDAAWRPVREELHECLRRLQPINDPNSYAGHQWQEIQELLHPSTREGRSHFAGFTDAELAAELAIRQGNSTDQLLARAKSLEHTGGTEP